jgi:hypothetical protein
MNTDNNARRYLIEKLLDPTTHKWVAVAFAIGTKRVDAVIRQKVQFEGGRYRATEVKSTDVILY